MTAEQVAQMTFDRRVPREPLLRVHAPQILPTVQARFDAALQGEAPADPFGAKPSARPPAPAG